MDAHSTDHKYSKTESVGVNALDTCRIIFRVSLTMRAGATQYALYRCVLEGSTDEL